MSSTVRQAIHESLIDRKWSSPFPTSSVNCVYNYDEERCSDQKRFFDLRRQLMLSDDSSSRLRLTEINEMLSPKNKIVESKPGLVPPADLSSISKSS